MNQLKNRIGLKRTLSIAMVLFIMSIIPGFTQNPPISNFITLLSTNENSVSVDDTYPEMVIVGNTIHVVWSQLSGNYHVFYRRSTDLGKTWEEPRIVYSLTYQTRESIKNPCSRKLAVDGNNVHIALCDMNQSENWASKIVYLKSTNNGSSFEPAK